MLYDAHHHRAFARRVTQEQAQVLLRNRRNSSCPLCKQALSDSWAFVVEGYWETIRRVFSANASCDEEAAAIAQLHSIAAGLLNTGYYARFFKEERKLGSGSFGSVYLCTHMMDEIELGVFAVKKLALGDDAKRLRQVVREVKALEKLRHINVIDYKHSWLEIDRHSELCPYVPFLYILMEVRMHLAFLSSKISTFCTTMCPLCVLVPLVVRCQLRNIATMVHWRVSFGTGILVLFEGGLTM